MCGVNTVCDNRLSRFSSDGEWVEMRVRSLHAHPKSANCQSMKDMHRVARATRDGGNQQTPSKAPTWTERNNTTLLHQIFGLGWDCRVDILVVREGKVFCSTSTWSPDDDFLYVSYSVAAMAIFSLEAFLMIEASRRFRCSNRFIHHLDRYMKSSRAQGLEPISVHTVAVTRIRMANPSFAPTLGRLKSAFASRGLASRSPHLGTPAGHSSRHVASPVVA